MNMVEVTPPTVAVNQVDRPVERVREFRDDLVGVSAELGPVRALPREPESPCRDGAVATSVYPFAFCAKSGGARSGALRVNRRARDL